MARFKLTKKPTLFNVLPIIGLFTAILVAACTTVDKGTTPARPHTTEQPISSPSVAVKPVAREVALASLTPYFQNQNNGAGAAALKEDRLTDAVAAFDVIAQNTSDRADRNRAQFLAAYLSYYAGDTSRAFAELPKLANALPLLEEVAYEVTALAAYKLNRYDDCILYAKKIKTDPSPAAMLIGDSYQQLEQYEDALRQYRMILDNHPGDQTARCQAQIIACIDKITTSYDRKKTEALQRTVQDTDSSQSPAAADDETADTDEAAPLLDDIEDTDIPQEADNDETAPFTAASPADTADADRLADLVKEKMGTTPADPNEYMRSLIDEALALLSAMEAQAPTGKWTKEALTHEETLLKRIGKKIPKAKKETRVAENLYEDAHELMLKRRHEKALDAYEKVLKFAKRNGALECRARYEQALVTGFMREHTKAAELFSAVAADCPMPDIRLKSLYKAGKSFMSANRYRDAVDMFAEVEKQFPSHSYADDARLHGARCWLALGNESRFLQMISTLPDDYPAGDMRAEALWVGAKRALDSNNLETAETILEKYYQTFPIEKGWYTAGRAGYWYGRVLELAGNLEEAQNRYEYVISTTPFSYYMVLAFSRLSELDGDRAELLTAELAPKVGEEKTTIPEKLLLKGTFATGVELIRLGLTTRGTKLIKSLLGRPDTKPSIHLAAAALFRQMGSFTDAKEISTATNDGWKNRYPTGDDYTAWTLAYPKAFDAEVTFAAEESGIEKALIFAIMREESSFNDRIESWANAVGLMQLILPTAKSMGKELDIKVTRKNLTDPKTNIRLGAKYLSYLGDMFNNHPALIVPGYNAGGGAVSRWLKEQNNATLDIFVESIPYEQTRGYTKRVLATYAAYKFLYDPDRPFLTLDFALQK